MKVFDSSFNFNKYPVNERLNGGADGDVFTSDDKIIKFVKIKDEKKNANNVWNKNKAIITKIMDISPKHFCKIYDFGLICVSENPYSIVYFYLMEKLNGLSDDEKKAIDTLISHRDYNRKINFNKALDLVPALDKYLEFDSNKMNLFIKQIQGSNIIHNDIHARNVMKDNFGNFKLIDFERMSIK